MIVDVVVYSQRTSFLPVVANSSCTMTPAQVRWLLSRHLD